MIPLLTYPAAKPALRATSSGVRERTRAAALSDEVWELHHIITDPVSRVKEVKSAKRQLLRALGKSKPGFVKRIRIDLAEPFETILEVLLSLPTTDNDIYYSEKAAASHSGESFHQDSEVEEVLRGIYEAANGRQVATQIGLIPIAPPVAAFLKDAPFVVETQLDFVLQALARLFSGPSPKASIALAKIEREISALVIQFPVGSLFWPEAPKPCWHNQIGAQTRDTPANSHHYSSPQSKRFSAPVCA